MHELHKHTMRATLGIKTTKRRWEMGTMIGNEKQYETPRMLMQNILPGDSIGTSKVDDRVTGRVRS